MAEKILFTCTRFDLLGGETRAYLESKGYELIVNQSGKPQYPREELKKILPEISGAVVALDTWDEELFSLAKKLKVMCKFGTGVDNIDLVSAKAHGVKVCNVRDGNANAVSEFTIGLMIDTLRHISEVDAQMKNGVAHPLYTGDEMKGRTIGLLGFGSIAQRVAKKLSGFDCRVLAYDVYPNEEEAKALGVRFVSMDELLSSSDILSIHIPSLPSTYHSINKETIQKMKKGSYIINCARGAIVDSEALCDAVESGHLAGAAVDVFEVEPLPIDDRLRRTHNIICTSHRAAETIEAYKNVARQAADSVVAVLEGREPANLLNP